MVKLTKSVHSFATMKGCMPASQHKQMIERVGIFEKHRISWNVPSLYAYQHIEMNTPLPLGIVTFLAGSILMSMNVTLHWKFNNKYSFALHIFWVWKPVYYTFYHKQTVLSTIKPGYPIQPNNIFASVARPQFRCWVLQT